MLACNCYVLAQRAGADAVIIDPGQRAMGPLRRILEENRLIPAAVLLTHGHIDHIWSAQKVCDHFGIPAYIHPADRFMLADPIRGFGPRLGQVLAGALFREPKQVVELDLDAAVIDLGGIPVTVDHTPGHTRGSVVFRVHGGGQERSDPGIGTGGQERSDPGIGTDGTDGSIGTGGNDVVFSGDTLFRQSVGRTDLPGGSGRDLLGSIMEKLMVLDDDTVVLPGHGDATTIGVERRTNPFLEGLTL
jgi:hydroxyacylglutathione hydrolase